MRIIAIIPARGNSKGLPGKNLALLAGKPLIAHTIGAALESGCFESVYVSTDDREISRVALQWNAEVIDRPASLAQDDTPTFDVVEHALNEMSQAGRYPDVLALLQPTSPLRTAGHIRQAVSLFLASDCASLVSVTQSEHHPYKAFLVKQGRLSPAFDEKSLHQPRQKLPPSVRQNGAIYLLSSANLRAHRSFFVSPAMAFEMPSQVSVDIDTQEDLNQCEVFLAKGTHG